VIKNVNYAFLVLGFSLLAESIAFFKAFKKINIERQGIRVISYLRKTKKSELIVVFLEDLAAICGLSIAMLLILLQHLTGILILDGIASVIIGMLLCVVAVFLGNEIRSLLIGESADPKLMKQVGDLLREEESINRVIRIQSLQLGPEDILISIKVEFNHRLTSIEISNVINGLEADIRRNFPDIKKIFIEPDIYNNHISRLDA